ncbi:MAG TPA: hypothetical protein VEH30_12285 [Terriglobales bacterium]|nr:hypothetical protein [Terriglobales bacterium]
MARGWESKSVEEQQAQASLPSNKVGLPLSPEQRKEQRTRQGLILARARVLQQLEALCAREQARRTAPRSPEPSEGYPELAEVPGSDELEAAHDSRYRDMLQKALADLDARLARLG